MTTSVRYSKRSSSHEYISVRERLDNRTTDLHDEHKIIQWLQHFYCFQGIKWLMQQL